MAEKWYKVELYTRPEITEVEVRRFTDRSVWVFSEFWEKLQRHPRRAESVVYHRTPNMAIEEARKVLQHRKNEAQEQLDHAVRRILDFESSVETGQVIKRETKRK